MEDVIQAATLPYRRQHRDGRPVPFCFVCARQGTKKYFCRQVLVGNPHSPFSLDVPLHEGGEVPHEWLAPSATTDDDALRLGWLSDQVLKGVLFEAGQAAGFSQYQLTRYLDTIQTDRCIIHLATNGHTNAGMAELMGTSEGTLRYRRQRIRPLLQHLFPPGAVVQHDRSGGNQERVRANQLTCPDQQWSCLQCTNRFP